MRNGKGEVVSVLLALEREKATGVLEFRGESVLTRVFVEAGVPTFAEAGAHGETLGNVLVREQLITQEQFAAVVRRMTDALVDDENVRFGEVVVELGILSRADLERALAAQVEKKIIGAVERGEGEWTFAEERERVAEAPHHASPVRTLLLDAAEHFDAERLAKIVAEERFPRTTRAAAALAEEYGLDERELAIVQRLDGTRSAHAIDAPSLLAALALGGDVEQLEAATVRPAPQAAPAIAATGRRRALSAVSREKAKAAVERFIREREAPLPKPRNEREATMFAEDEFQSGRRMLAQGNFEGAREKLESAATRAPGLSLYRLYADFARSRTAAGFADAQATKRLAIQIVREDPEQSFAHYVLGYLALSENERETAKRFFRQAFKLDPELVDAGRQARLLDLRPAETPAGSSKRTMILGAALALIVIVAIAALVLLKK